MSAGIKKGRPRNKERCKKTSVYLRPKVLQACAFIQAIVKDGHVRSQTDAIDYALIEVANMFLEKYPFRDDLYQHTEHRKNTYKQARPDSGDCYRIVD